MRYALVPLLALALTGCPPTFGEVADQYAPRINARHAEVKQVVSTFPPAGSVKNDRAEFETTGQQLVLEVARLPMSCGATGTSWPTCELSPRFACYSSARKSGSSYE
jgi:hypothetical protein